MAAAVARKNKAKADTRVIKVWRNMTVLDLALVMDKDLGITLRHVNLPPEG